MRTASLEELRCRRGSDGSSDGGSSHGSAGRVARPRSTSPSALARGDGSPGPVAALLQHPFSWSGGGAVDDDALLSTPLPWEEPTRPEAAAIDVPVEATEREGAGCVFDAGAAADTSLAEWRNMCGRNGSVQYCLDDLALPSTRDGAATRMQLQDSRPPRRAMSSTSACPAPLLVPASGSAFADSEHSWAAGIKQEDRLPQLGFAFAPHGGWPTGEVGAHSVATSARATPRRSASPPAVSYTHLTLPTTPYV